MFFKGSNGLVSTVTRVLMPGIAVSCATAQPPGHSVDVGIAVLMAPGIGIGVRVGVNVARGVPVDVAVDVPVTVGLDVGVKVAPVDIT